MKSMESETSENRFLHQKFSDTLHHLSTLAADKKVCIIIVMAKT
jgi:hypothetical protein